MSAHGESVDDRQARLGRNEGLFREINNKIEGLNSAFAVVPEDFEIVCECGSVVCDQRLVVLTAEYQRVRRDPTLFMLIPGHEDESVEAVVELQGTHVVVRKYPGSTAERAAQTVPEAA